MRLLISGRFAGTAIMTLLIVAGFVCSNEALICWGTTPTFAGKSVDKSVAQSVSRVTWSADGTMLLARSRGGDNLLARLTIHEFTAPSELDCHSNQHFGHDCYDATISPDGHHVLMAAGSGELIWLELSTLEEKEIAKAPDRSVFCSTAVSYDGAIVAGATDHGVIHLRDLTRDTSLVQASKRPGMVSKLQFSPDHRCLLVSRNDGSIEILDVETGLQVRFLEGNGRRRAVAFLTSSNRVATYTGDGTLQVWDVATGTAMQTETIREMGSECGEWLPVLDTTSDGSIVAFGGSGRQIMIWDLVGGRRQRLIENPASILDLKFSSDGKFLAVTGLDALIRIYETATGAEMRQFDTSRCFECENHRTSL